jgi:GH15 family glucan-1,4-alpha-glucosidase
VPGMIEDYALIGDMQSAALISRDGSVDWLCLPRFDSPACFAALLGTERHGHWRIAPTGAGGAAAEGIEVTRRYRGDTLILETDWHTPGGAIRVTDFMPPRDGQTPVLVRDVQGLSGAVDMDCVFVVRFGYGQVLPWMRRVDGKLLGVAGPDSVWLDTPVTLTGRGFAHRATFTVQAGERVPFVLTWLPSHATACEPVDPHQAEAGTRRFWSDWVSRCTYQGR